MGKQFNQCSKSLWRKVPPTPLWKGTGEWEGVEGKGGRAEGSKIPLEPDAELSINLCPF